MHVRYSTTDSGTPCSEQLRLSSDHRACMQRAALWEIRIHKLSTGCPQGMLTASTVDTCGWLLAELALMCLRCFYVHFMVVQQQAACAASTEPLRKPPAVACTWLHQSPHICTSEAAVVEASFLFSVQNS
jgi:hypothetical protein